MFSLGLVLVLVYGASASAQSQQSPPLPPGKPDLPALPGPPPNSLPNSLIVQPAFSVVIDPAHGGADTGARINPTSPEKDLTLALAGRLHSALTARGVAAVLTRVSDTSLPVNQRAGIANHALASACLVLHATATGAGVHLYTSSLAPAPPNSPSAAPALIPWQTAQATWITRSLRLSSEINSALGQAGIPTSLGVASVKPLDNLSCPAVAIEISPLVASPANKALPISDSSYQQRIIDAIAAAILQWRSDWKQQP
jgi:N-acetylmuramoyl-L-alanine amidase